jgi:hypothetical protein
MRPIIQTPRGVIMVMPNGQASLVWSTTFQPKWQERFTQGQIALDNAVLADCEPYTPLLTSMLIKSGTLGTVPGEGVVSWIAPYAHVRYYTPRKTPSTTGPLRGPFWFENAKAARREAWLALYASKMRGTV